MPDTVEITGNTYAVRDKLRALGGRCIKRGSDWVWLIPAARADEARALVAAVPQGRRCGGVRRGPRVCATCGCKINYGVYCGKCEFGR